MTYFPTEPPYTDDYLSEEHKEFIHGWDLATEEIETYFDNREDPVGLKTIDKIIEEVADEVKQDLIDWMRRTRQEFIVGFVDGYSDEELKERGFEG